MQRYRLTAGFRLAIAESAAYTGLKGKLELQEYNRQYY
jgi:hypothetical protein